MHKDDETAELRARVEKLEANIKTLAEVMSQGGGRLQALQAVIHALIVTNPNAAAFGPSLQHALDVTEANMLATSLNEVYVESMQATKEACLGDLARIAPREDDDFLKALTSRIVWMWTPEDAQAPA
jgi:phage tail protein X